MSRDVMEKAISEVPNSSRALGNTRQHLLDIAEKIDEDIVGILVAAPGSGVDRVALVITQARIIEVTQGGAVQAWRYADMSSLVVSGGRKKLVGREHMFLHVELSASGGTLNWLLPTAYYEQNMRLGKVAEDACRRAQIDKL
jgi:hypothetical protein